MGLSFPGDPEPAFLGGLLDWQIPAWRRLVPAWNPASWSGYRLQLDRLGRDVPAHFASRRRPRDLGLAYVLLLLGGSFGVHKLYLRNFDAALTYLILNIFGWGMSGLLVGYLLLMPLWVMLAVDLVTLPRQLARANSRCAQ
ncbi:NINE protein [Kineosporia babensis]|uniref:NINE protein n=1 Tax=Kineosporia babensis TaxID=499548 RepID=A0A9X1NG51_9ACTN|nr:NINE protein [Kineosporia babensis]